MLGPSGCGLFLRAGMISKWSFQPKCPSQNLGFWWSFWFWNRATPSDHHPFLSFFVDGLFHEINHPLGGCPHLWNPRTPPKNFRRNPYRPPRALDDLWISRHRSYHLCSILLRRFRSVYMGVSIDMGVSKMVGLEGKISRKYGSFGGTPISGNHHIHTLTVTWPILPSTVVTCSDNPLLQIQG